MAEVTVWVEGLYDEPDDREHDFYVAVSIISHNDKYRNAPAARWELDSTVTPFGWRRVR